VPSLGGLNLFTVTDLIRAHAMMQNSFAARRVLSAIELDTGSWSASASGSIQMDTKCYNTVLTALVNSDDIENADKLFDQMCDVGKASTNTKFPQKNIVTYNIMIGAYARVGRREDAFDAFNEMRSAGLKPDKFTITALIKAVVKDGEFEVAHTLLLDMKKAGIEADVVAYNTIIGALCKRSSWFEAKELVAEMESKGINPDSKTYGLLMNGLLKLNKPGPCLTLFESACADQRTAGLMDNVQLYTTAITAAASIGDSERAFELISRMNFAGVKPNMKTLTALMSACISDQKHDLAIDVYKKLQSPDGYAEALAIKAYCGIDDFTTALELMQSEKMKGKQTMLSYNYMIGSALSKEDYHSGRLIMIRSQDFFFVTFHIFLDLSHRKPSFVG
jgi:pentatricopeptide repeat protein